MSLTKAHNRMIEGSTVNVVDFGADPTGTSDSSTAIQAAIDSITEFENGRVVFPRGTYNVGSGISTNGRALHIEGNGSTLNLTANASYLLTVNTISCEVSNLKLTKGSGVTASAVYVAGTRHVFNNIQTGDQVWTDIFHCVDAKECHWENCNLYNDVTSQTGSIFKLDYCVNNTWDAMFMGYCENGWYCTTATQPVSGYKSEGVQISNCIAVFCDKGVRGDAVTNLAASNCVFDFCGAQGIFCTNGQALLVNNCWFAGDTDDNFIAVGTSSGFNGGSVIGNFITEGNNNLTNAKAVSIGGDFINIMGNTFSSINGGIIVSGNSKHIGNDYRGGGTEITSSAKIRLDRYSYVQNADTSGYNYFAKSPASYTASSIRSDSTTASGTGWNHFYGTSSDATVANILIKGNGDVENANGTYATISDERLKQDIVDAGSQWSDIKNIRFRNYRLKSDVALDESAPSLLGVVAQELEQVSPNLVSDTNVLDADGRPTGETVKSVKQSILLMKAAKALQEAIERIEQLEARVTALEP